MIWAYIELMEDEIITKRLYKSDLEVHGGGLS